MLGGQGLSCVMKHGLSVFNVEYFILQVPSPVTTRRKSLRSPRSRGMIRVLATGRCSPAADAIFCLARHHLGFVLEMIAVVKLKALCQYFLQCSNGGACMYTDLIVWMYRILSYTQSL